MLVSNKNEKVRADRDFVTKTFDPARDDIENATDAALNYFPLTADNRTKLLEAHILASERGVRRSITSLLKLHESLEQEHHAAQEAFDTLIAELTGGSFQSSDAASDVAAVVRIADAGANLKAALLTLRSAALRKAISEDPLSSLGGLLKVTWGYIRG